MSRNLMGSAASQQLSVYMRHILAGPQMLQDCLCRCNLSCTGMHMLRRRCAACLQEVLSLESGGCGEQHAHFPGGLVPQPSPAGLQPLLHLHQRLSPQHLRTQLLCESAVSMRPQPSVIILASAVSCFSCLVYRTHANHVYQSHAISK